MTKEPLKQLQEARSSRRALLKGMLVGLGAGVLVQASGGVVALAQDTPKKELTKLDKQQKLDKNKSLEKVKEEHKEDKTESKTKSKGGVDKKGGEPKKEG